MRRFNLMDKAGNMLISEGETILEAIGNSPIPVTNLVLIEDISSPLDGLVSEVWREVCKRIANRVRQAEGE